MRFAVLQKDETLPELVKRLYRETQAGSLSRAERALRDQNPGLAAGGGAGGAIVVVPDVPGTTATAQTRDLPDVVGFLLDALGDIVGSLKDVLNTAVDRMEEEAQDTLERATDRE